MHGMYAMEQQSNDASMHTSIFPHPAVLLCCSVEPATYSPPPRGPPLPATVRIGMAQIEQVYWDLDATIAKVCKVMICMIMSMYDTSDDVVSSSSSACPVGSSIHIYISIHHQQA